MDSNERCQQQLQTNPGKLDLHKMLLAETMRATVRRIVVSRATAFQSVLILEFLVNSEIARRNHISNALQKI